MPSTIHHFTLTTPDGVDLAVSRWLPADAAPTARVVLAHGFTASRSEAAVQELARVMVESGAEVTVFDARGHGESGGETTIGKLEQLDVATVVDATVEAASEATASANPSGTSTVGAAPPLVLVGISMGAIASLNYLASVQPNPVDAVLTISSPATWKFRLSRSTLVMAFMSRTALGRRFARRRAGVRVTSKLELPDEPAAVIARVGVPVGIIGGNDDRLVGETAAAQLYDAAREPKKLTVIEDAGHSLNGQAFPATVEMLGWLIQQTATS